MNVIRIVVVEDHPVVREGIREMLQREKDIDVIGEADSADSAIDLCGKLLPDIVLMDVSLPGVSGLEAARIVKQRYPMIKILVLTAFDDEAFVVEALGIGASGFLLKSQSSSEILAAVRGVSSGDTVIAPSSGMALARQASLRKSEPEKQALSSLTIREQQILQLSSEGITAKEIARIANISERTVHTHFRNIFIKLNAVSRTDAVVRAAKLGWIRLP